MPIYEYYCSKCDEEFQLRRSMIQIDDPAECPKCGTEGERQMTAFASMVGLRLKTPSNTIYRKPSTKRNAKSKKEVKSSE